MALDYGSVRTGLACSDVGRVLATGIPTFVSGVGKSLRRHVQQVAQDREVTGVVIGIPVPDAQHSADGIASSNPIPTSTSAPSTPISATSNSIPTTSPVPSPFVLEIFALAKWLDQNLGLPVALWDETMTSREAEERLRVAPKKVRMDKGAVDRLAAEVLLQEFLEAGCPFETQAYERWQRQMTPDLGRQD